MFFQAEISRSRVSSNIWPRSDQLNICKLDYALERDSNRNEWEDRKCISIDFLSGLERVSEYTRGKLLKSLGVFVDNEFNRLMSCFTARI